MVKVSDLSFEDYVCSQKPSRKRALYTKSSYEQNHLIRNHLADWLLHQFEWQYWVTFTFGYKPDLSEVQDILYWIHQRLDQRILKHKKGMEVMSVLDRSRWILFPEYRGRGLHYHGFIELNTHPNLGNSYRTEWWWLESAFRNLGIKMNPRLTNGGPITVQHTERGYRTKDNLQMILYSMKELGCGASHHDQEPSQDRFSHTIVSWTDWKIRSIYKHGRNKIEYIPPRPDKVFDSCNLESFMTSSN